MKKSTARAKNDEDFADAGRILLAEQILAIAERPPMPIPIIEHRILGC